VLLSTGATIAAGLAGGLAAALAQAIACCDWAWRGEVLMATGAMGWCPPYAFFGWFTCTPQSDAGAGKA
jgi:hypothetical protein